MCDFSASAPDTDVQARIQQVRLNLLNIGDPNWLRYSDADILEKVAPSYVPPQYINQPKKDIPVRDISLDELKNIIQTRERFPDYRSEVNISPEMKQAIINEVRKKDISRSSLYGRQPFTIVPSWKGPDVPISDDLAVRAIADAKTQVPLPVTDFDQTVQKNTDMNKRYNDRHPVSFNASVDSATFSALVTPIRALDSFSAFAEVATAGDTGGGNWLTGLLGVANTAASTYGSITNAAAANKLAQTNANAGLVQAQLTAQMLANQNAAKKDTGSSNMMPILLIGGVLFVVVLLAVKK